MSAPEFASAIGAIVLSGTISAPEQISNTSVSDSNDSSRDGIQEIVTGHPFSAIRYARTVKVLVDGTLQFQRNEEYPVGIARDSDGRMRMEIVPVPPECNHPEMRIPPPCPSWLVAIFDPVSHVITHWPEGEIAAHVAVDFPMSASQWTEIEDYTSELPSIANGPGSKDSDTVIEKLGEKEMDGVRATGVRSTTFIPSSDPEGKTAVRKIHEVWISSDMKLVIRVVDGDPQGTETIRGLEHIRTDPGASMFAPPTGYEMQHRQESSLADSDVEELKHWLVE